MGVWGRVSPVASNIFGPPALTDIFKSTKITVALSLSRLDFYVETLHLICKKPVETSLVLLYTYSQDPALVHPTNFTPQQVKLILN